MRHPLFLSALALASSACNPLNTGFQPRDTDEPVDTGWSRDTDEGDTDDTDGDLDDDGFTPEQGDCDDDDVRVSPARPEDNRDGKDNDCDGRIDEEWSGFDIGRVDDDRAGSIITLDTLGRADATVNLSSGCVPSWLDHFGEGWVVSNGGVSVALVAPDGTCVDIGDFSDAKVYEYGVWGIATMPDGFGFERTVLAVTLGSLVSVTAAGGVTDLATWVMDLEDPVAHEFAANSVAVNPASGEVGLFDYFGGFGTWTSAGGLVVHRKGDWENPTLLTSTGAHRDGGGWYVLGTDALTGTRGIYRFDLDTGEWVLEEEWDAELQWSPQQVAIDGDSGDWYITATAGTGPRYIFPTVYRIGKASGYTADFYRISTDYAGGFYGITTNYTYGG